MAITQNDLQILKSEVMADTDDGGGLPTANIVTDGVSNNLFPDVSDLDRQNGRVRLRKVFLGVQTANADLLQAARLIFTELPDNPNISVFAFKATSFADDRSAAKNKIESYLAPGTKWPGHLLETQLAGQRVIQISLDKSDQVPAVGQPLVIVQNEGATDEFYQYIRPIKVDTAERRFQRTASDAETRVVATIEFGDTLYYTFNGLTVPEFYRNESTSRRAILREARVADAAKYYSASKLVEPIEAMQTNQARLNSIYTQVVPSTQVESPILRADPVNNISAQARGQTEITINQSVNITPSTAYILAGGIAIGSLNLTIQSINYIDRKGEVVNSLTLQAVGSIDYGIGKITWYSSFNRGQTTITGSYKPASRFTRVAQTDYQQVGLNAGYNYVRELGAVPLPGSLRISYQVQGDVYIVQDDGRGNLIDEGGNGRGTVSDKTVLLTTAAIPDAESYIIYTFGVDLGYESYSDYLLSAHHSFSIPDVVKGDVIVTWGEDKTATISNGAITGDATGVMEGGRVKIAPNETVARGTEFSMAYVRTVEASTIEGGGFEDVIPDGNNGVFETTIGFAETFVDSYVDVQLHTQAGVALKVGLVADAAGTGLNVNSVLRPIFNSPKFGGVVSDEPTSWVSVTGEHGQHQWDVALVSSSISKPAKTISLKIRVTRNTSGVQVISRPGVSPVFKTTVNTVPMRIKKARTYARVTTSPSTESATRTALADFMRIALPQDSAAPIVANSIVLDALAMPLSDKDGKIVHDGSEVGEVDYQAGGITLDTWTAGVMNSVALSAMIRENDPVPVANIIFRTPSAPIKKASLQIDAELSDGTKVALTTDEQGKITGHKSAHGFVEFKAGVVALYFYNKLKVSDYPDITSEPWYDADNIYDDGGVNYINEPVYVKPDTVRYNAIAYSYLPLDSELIGLDPARLPTDGRVPFVRKGDNVAITELKTMALPTSAKNDEFDLGFERLSDVQVIDSTGKKVTPDYLDIDLDAGTLTLNSMFEVTEYTPPLTAKYRIMDIGLVIETDISGRVTLSTPITHDYSTDAVFSSMLVAGDMQARAYNVFSQKSWTGRFSDVLIGDRATAQLQTTNHPIIVTNEDSIKDRWALVFTSSTSFNIIGELLGQIGTGSTTARTAPINPVTGKPYFVIDAAAWSSGWSAGNVVRFNTDTPKYPVWLGNAIGQHVGSSKDNYDFTIGYHANIDRDREE